VRTATPWAANAAKLLCSLLASLTVWVPAAQAGEYCPSDARVGAVDLSAPVDQSFLDRMRGIGIKTIIRYYDHEDETLPGKTLRSGERDQILANGFQTAVVFQHHNNQFASFTALRGRQDAERSLALAAENSQPRGSAIYFGVDGGWNTPYELASVVTYFRELRDRLAGFGKLCWLAAPTSWPDYHAYYQTKQWGLAQLRTSQCGGRSVDFNLANDMVADYGQFGR
jgi:hypothetical protein